jgi:hypothetical protein
VTRLVALVAAASLLVLAGEAAAQDPPVSISVKAPAVAPRGIAVPVRVRVTADPGALTYRATGPAPLKVKVRLARECGATFETTSGQVLLDRTLRPKPRAHAAYERLFRVKRSLRQFGSWTACAYLEEQGDDRLWAFDATTQVDVTRRCTRTARRAIRHPRHAAQFVCARATYRFTA